MTERGIVIRDATADDAREIFALEKRYIDCPWTAEQIAAETVADECVFLVATADGGPVGYVSCEVIAGECEIANVAVAEEYRRRGIGAKLFVRLLSEAKKRGAEKAFLLVREDNAAAIGLYRKLGFTVVGERKNYYNTKNALIMSKSM